MGRFSDIKRGPELAAAYTAYQAYLALPKEQKQAKYKAMNVEKVVATRKDYYLQPFGGAANLYLVAKFPVDTPAPDTTTTADAAQQKETAPSLISTLKTAIGTRVQALAPTGATDIIIDPPKFKFARAILFQKGTGTPVATSSRFTNIKYLRYQSKSVSAPFGKNGAADYFEAAAKDVAAACTTFVGAANGNRVSFVPQKSSLA